MHVPLSRLKAGPTRNSLIESKNGSKSGRSTIVVIVVAVIGAGVGVGIDCYGRGVIRGIVGGLVDPVIVKVFRITVTGKCMDLLSDVALLKAAQLKKTLKKNKLETYKLHASGSGDGVTSQPKVPDEQEDKTTCTDKGTGTKPRVSDVPKYQSESENKSWGDSGDDDSNDDDSDDVTKDDDDVDNDADGDKEASYNEKTNSDEDENPNLNQNDDK
nr:hypothetical protein [Tanacetum cinerariifolium]